MSKNEMIPIVKYIAEMDKRFIDELNRHIKTDFTIKLPVDDF